MSGTVDAFIPSFLEYLQFEKRYSAHTIKSYETDLQQMELYLRSTAEGTDVPVALQGITLFQLKSWLASLRQQGLEPRSINRKISAANSYFRFLKRQGVVEVNPMTSIRTLKTPKRLPSFLKEEQTAGLMGEPSTDNWKAITASLVISILYNTGLRVSELVSLRSRHVDDRLQQIKVLGKGNKERIIPLKPELLEQIKAYEKLKTDHLDNMNGEYLLLNSQGKPLNVKYVYREVRQQLQPLKQVSRKSPHVMRHTFATQLMNNGADLNAVKELLGHASLAATQVYTHNTIEKLKDIHKQAHPKGM